MRRNVVSPMLLLSSLVIGSVAGATTTAACGYHGLLGDGFSALHPRSIDVAIAISEAADENKLDREIVAPKFADFLALHRATRRLDRVREELQIVIANAAVPAFSLLLVESGVWSRYVADGNTVRLVVHTDAPPAGEAVVVTGNAVLAAIIAGRVTVQDAMQRRLIVVDGPQELNLAINAIGAPHGVATTN
jgi:hypothetical protein